MTPSTIMPTAPMLLRGRRDNRDRLITVMGRAQMEAPRAKRVRGAQPGAERR